MAAAIATQARARLDVGDVRTLVIIGGETAAVLLGDEPRLVAGYAAPGMPWSLDQAGGGPIVITKAGSFGGPDALVHLLGGHDD